MFLMILSNIWKVRMIMIKTDEFVTEVSGISSLSELLSADLGKPCLLIVHGSSSLSADVHDEELKSFFKNAPYITALADNEPDSDIAALFDMVIPSGDTSEYTAKLFKDKTKWQAEQINACFITARNGSQADILDCESKAFFRLMAEKNGGSINE